MRNENHPEEKPSLVKLYTNAIRFYCRLFYGINSFNSNPSRPFKVLNTVTQLVFIFALSTIIVIVAAMKGPLNKKLTMFIVAGIFAIMRVVHPLFSLLQMRNRKAASAVFAVISAILLIIMNLMC